MAKFIVNKEKYQALLADHQADGRGPPVVRGPQVENRWLIRISNLIEYRNNFLVVFIPMNMVNLFLKERNSRIMHNQIKLKIPNNPQ